MSLNLDHKEGDGLRGRLIPLESGVSLNLESPLPSLALILIEKSIDDVFEKSIINLLDNGVVCFCVSGENADHLAGIIDDIIITGRYEIDGWFKRKSVPTSFHHDESIDSIALFIDTQVKLRKLNPIINVVYDIPSTTVIEWKKILKMI